MTFRLDGRVAVVTGASRGIGQSIATHLAEAGAYVVINYSNDLSGAKKTLELIERHGGEGELLECDVSREEEVKNSFRELATRLEHIDILVNNAGVAIAKPFVLTKKADFDLVFDTNVGGLVSCTRACIAGMVKRRWGRVLNISSVVADRPQAGLLAYAGTKGAINAMTRTLACEYAAYGINVNAIAPGLIDTAMADALPETVRDQVLANTPLGRIGQPSEIGATALFLCSDEAAYVTGQVIGVGGGMHM
ncbi:MAG: 3-oxoacyl-ACP reductase FabG [Myxococcales bacterium]|nr:3-oxoacyl-ACP reductase FabG [Myxococcales bacterium]